MIELVPATSSIKSGDTITMYVSVKRKWYQVWKPRWSKQLQKFTVSK